MMLYWIPTWWQRLIELLSSLQDDILMLKVEASQEGERYLEQKEMEKARQLSKQKHDAKNPAS